VPVLVSERVREHEGIERVRFRRRQPVALTDPRRHLRRHAEQPMPLLLKALHQQTFGAFDRDPRHRAVSPQPLGELPQAVHVVSDLALLHDPPGGIKHADLMVRVTPVDPDEHPVGRGRRDRSRVQHEHHPSRMCHRPGRPCWNLIKALEARLPLATTRPASTGRDRSA